jgi:hypothetical protein
MSGIGRKSMWWLFLLLFGLTIGGIQSLGWWTRQASAQAQASHSYSTPAPHRIETCVPKHWRSIIMRQ